MDIFYPIQMLADLITYNILNLEISSHIGNALNFFIYDSIKIFILLVIIVYIMSIINHYLPIEKIRDFLSRNKFYGLDYVFASIFGAITPFCSCSSIPMFVGFVRAGIPLGITFAFLITSPLINEVAIALFIGLFGWKITIIYILSGLLLGTIGGWIIGKLRMEDQIHDFVLKKSTNNQNNLKDKLPIKEFFKIISKDSFDLIKKITPYVLLGVAIGAIIHGYIPQGFFQEYITKENIFAVPLAVILGIPMYANAAGVIPIIKSLIVAGIPIGTALAFMMAVVGLSLPEFLILKKVMKTKLLLSFFGIIGLFMTILGYLYNAIL
ncbi:MAG: permease [Candidatus Absconditabacteria bacterium]